MYVFKEEILPPTTINPAIILRQLHLSFAIIKVKLVEWKYLLTKTILVLVKVNREYKVTMNRSRQNKHRQV